MYVGAINGDGTIVISEMNGPAGFGVVGTRTISESSARYILLVCSLNQATAL